MNRSNAFFSVITGLLLFSAAGTFAAHHENKSHSNINGVFTLAFELGAEEAPWSVSIEDQEGATSVTRFQLKQTGTFANGSAFEATGDCGGLQESNTSSGVCMWTDRDNETYPVRFTCDNGAGNGFCWGSAAGLTGKYKGKVNRWSQRNQDGNVTGAGIWADAE